MLTCVIDQSIRAAGGGADRDCMGDAHGKHLFELRLAWLPDIGRHRCPPLMTP